MTQNITNTPFVPPPDPTDLATGHYTESGILNNIFNLVLNMTTVLQDAAAAQANRLTFLSNWQAAYNDAMQQVHTFTGYSDTQTNDTIRGDLNRANANYTQTLQNYQSLVGDAAKSLQSNVSQSNDAVNQQSNLGTTIIQEMSTLLGTIFH